MRENLKPMLGKVITVEGTFVNVKKKAGGKRLGIDTRVAPLEEAALFYYTNIEKDMFCLPERRLF